ncbi:MAG: CHAT domain-containing protein [Myxococcota bacterium]
MTLDLELEITWKRDSRSARFDYLLHGDHSCRSFVGPRLRTDLVAYQRRILAVVEGFNRGRGPGSEVILHSEVRRKARRLGQDLGRQLLPEALQRWLWTHRSDLASLQIRSDEPSIPWELLVLSDLETTDPEAREKPWCPATSVPTTRWPLQVPWPRQLETKPILFLLCASDAVRPRLGGVEQELAALTRLADRLGVGLEVLANPSVDEIESAVLDGDWGVFHVSSHGEFDPGAPVASPLICGGLGSFQPRDLTRAWRASLGQQRPLVFLNACRAARQGAFLTRFEGWAPRWLQSGCSAFVAPLWSVRSSLAATFASVFYESLGRGESLGEAALAARSITRKETAGRLDWAAYQIYGRVRARYRGEPTGPDRAAEPGAKARATHPGSEP